MPKPTLDTLEQRFVLIQDVYSKLGLERHPQRGNLDRLFSTIAGVFKKAKTPSPLPERINYAALKQVGRPALKPKQFFTGQIQDYYVIDLKHQIANAQGIKKDKAATLALSTIEPLTKAIQTGDLNDWLRFYQAFDAVGLASDLPSDKLPFLSFWSGAASNNVKASDIAKLYSNSGAGARDVDQVAFEAVRSSASTLNPLKKTNEVAYNHVWYELFGLQSSLYATLARGDVICFMPQGITIGNIFWNNELPILRRLQQQGHVDGIYVYTEGTAPTGYDSTTKDATERRGLWFEKAVELTSPKVSLSRRKDDGGWEKLPMSADFFVKWLLSSDANTNRLVLYRYRVAAKVYAKLVSGSGESVIEVWKPFISDDVKRIRIVGYPSDELAQQIGRVELFLFANYMDWVKLPVWPNHLLYTEECFLLVAGARMRVQAILHQGNWVYPQGFSARLSPVLGKAKLDELLDGTANESEADLSKRLAALRVALKIPPVRPAKPEVKGPTTGNVRNLISRWEGMPK